MYCVKLERRGTGDRNLNYYDDLGVSPDASQQEIRESYRALVRLLHPDQYSDPVLKSAAEIQMRRINLSHAALADPESRRRYDALLTNSLDRPVPIYIKSPPPPKKIRIAAGTLAWAGAAVICVGLIYWLSSQGQQAAIRSETLEYSSPRPAMEPAKPASDVATGARAPQRAPQPSRSRPQSRQSPARPPSFEPAPLATIAPMELDPLLDLHPAAPASVKMPDLPPIPVPVRNRFAGFWVYPHSKDSIRDRKLYPPDFIQAAIVEERNGAIRGRYRSRYLIYDRAISPNVNFDFEGRANGASAKLPWRGADGSNGIVEIKMVSENEMEVAWSATKLGQSLALVSGTAVLMRRPD